MKNLLYKEFKLALHPTVYIFPLFALMLLIPSYPYYVAFFYTCLSIFFIFMAARETNDTVFTVLLPIRKRDAVKARMYLTVIIELFQIVFSIPFAFVGVAINPEGANAAGIESNVAFYGLVFVMYALFNYVFFTYYYKTAYNAGKGFILSGAVMLVYVAAAEIVVAAVPSLHAFLDTTEPSAQIKQLPVLAAGILVYALLSAAGCKKASASFEKVDL